MSWKRRTAPNGDEAAVFSPDPLVVPVDELRAVLEPHVRIQNSHLKSNLCDVLPLGGVQALAAWSGVKPDTIANLLQRSRQRHVGLGLADMLLVAVGETGALQDGRLHVEANPLWSATGWEREILSRGVDTLEGIL